IKIQTALCRGQFRRDFFGDVDHIDVNHAGEPSCLEYNVDMVMQPILKKRIRNSDVEGFAVLFYQLCWFEPRVVTLLVDLFFDNIQNLLPGIHYWRSTRSLHPQALPVCGNCGLCSHSDRKSTRL